MRALTPSGSANSCNRRAGARQDRHAGSRQQTRSCDGLRRRLEPRDRAEEAAARQQQAETPQHKAQCAGPAVQVDAKAASKTAASGHARPNVPLAPPPRRSLAPPPNGPCSSATRAAETRLSPPKQQQQQWQRDLTSAVRPRRSLAGARLALARRPSRRCPQPRQISGMGSSGRRRRLAPRPQRSLQRRGRSARRRRSRLADVHTWPALACWQRSDSTLPTKVF
mmetsp:Transcript_13817/g.40563  ORF Transcript_13817/g.40563 Transcript_13817/m.40563 type:complete len:224 (+) Transcript_13817:18-689(+)